MKNICGLRHISLFVLMTLKNYFPNHDIIYNYIFFQAKR